MKSTFLTSLLLVWLNVVALQAASIPAPPPAGSEFSAEIPQHMPQESYPHIHHSPHLSRRAETKPKAKSGTVPNAKAPPKKPATGKGVQKGTDKAGDKLKPIVIPKPPSKRRRLTAKELKVFVKPPKMTAANLKAKAMNVYHTRIKIDSKGKLLSTQIKNKLVKKIPWGKKGTTKPAAKSATPKKSTKTTKPAAATKPKAKRQSVDNSASHTNVTDISKRLTMWPGSSPEGYKRKYPYWPARWHQDAAGYKPMYVNMGRFLIGAWGAEATYGAGTYGLDGCVSITISGLWWVLSGHFPMIYCVRTDFAPSLLPSLRSWIMELAMNEEQAHSDYVQQGGTPQWFGGNTAASAMRAIVTYPIANPETPEGEALLHNQLWSLPQMAQDWGALFAELGINTYSFVDYILPTDGPGEDELNVIRVDGVLHQFMGPSDFPSAIVG